MQRKEGTILNTLHFKAYYLSNMKNMHESTLIETAIDQL
jgi:hypothetical protein